MTAGGPGEKLAKRDEVGVSSFIDPTSPNDEFLSVIAKMSDGTAE
jgi:hypothetical protein